MSYETVISNANFISPRLRLGSTLGKSPEEMSTRASLLDSHDIINTKIANDGRDKDTVVIEYLKNVKYPPIGDFTPGKFITNKSLIHKLN